MFVLTLKDNKLGRDKLDKAQSDPESSSLDSFANFAPMHLRKRKGLFSSLLDGEDSALKCREV